MQRWPWFTIFVALGLGLSSPGRVLIEQVFFASDPIARADAEPMMYRAIGILLAAGIAEIFTKRWLARRKAET